MLRSFRVRLIIAFLALFAAVSVAVSFTGMMLREQQVRGIFDRELKLRSGIIADSLTQRGQVNDRVLNETIDNLSEGFYFRDIYVQIYNDRSEPVAHSANLGGYALRLRRPFEDRSMDGVIVEGDTNGRYGPEGPKRLRGLRTRFIGTDQKEYLLIVGADPQYATESIRVTRWLFLGGNLGGLAAAGAAAWFVTGAMSRRIGELADQIEQVGPDNLQKRIEISDRDEIASLASHINAMLDRLKAGFDTQERFIHDASHELKTPVATVQAEAQALLLSDPTRTELIEFVKGTNDEMRRLGRLTEALLLLTRTDDTVLVTRFMPMEIGEATISAIRHLSAMATDHQVRLKVEPEGGHDDALLVRCDPDLLEAMISNLIRNAIRFSPRGGEVTIRTEAAAHEVLVFVEDQGPGIPQDILPRLFERYFETSQFRVRRGAGLGLAIAATVAKLHGGTVEATNRAEGGARFIVRLPRESDADGR